MKSCKQEYDTQKRARAGTAAIVRAAVALYVAWLGVKIIRGVGEDGSSVPPVVGWTIGIVFITASLAFCFYIWRRWRADLKDACIGSAQENAELEDSDG